LSALSRFLTCAGEKCRLTRMNILGQNPSINNNETMPEPILIHAHSKACACHPAISACHSLDKTRK
ncbi:MAG TPA: hypothetical protein PLN69_12195, partial [bacterium]|nr:hypothetical protein [bacterium]